MSSLSSAVCMKCNFNYDSSTRKACRGTCSHTICEPCFDKKRSSECPVCKRGNAFVNKQINYDAMKVLEQLVKDISLKRIADGVLDKESLTKGLCSECNEHRKLRLCIDCLVDSGLLVQSENGDVKVTTDTSGELLEMKILRIRSSAFCADCRIDKKLHAEHNITTLDKIKNLADTTEILNAMSVVSLSLNKIKTSTEDLKTIRNPIRCLHTGNQILELAFNNLKNIPSQNNTPGEHGLIIFTKLLANAASSVGDSGFMNKMYQKCDEIFEDTTDPEEKMELEKAKEQMDKYREQCKSLGSYGKLGAEDLQFIYKLLESGSFQSILSEMKWDSGDVEAKEVMQDVLNISKDFRKTIPFKIPQEYVKYADFAESCFKFFCP